MGTWILVCILGPFAFIGLVALFLFFVAKPSREDLDVFSKAARKHAAWTAARDKLAEIPSRVAAE